MKYRITYRYVLIQQSFTFLNINEQIFNSLQQSLKVLNSPQNSQTRDHGQVKVLLGLFQWSDYVQVTNWQLLQFTVQKCPGAPFLRRSDARARPSGLLSRKFSCWKGREGAQNQLTREGISAVDFPTLSFLTQSNSWALVELGFHFDWIRARERKWASLDSVFEWFKMLPSLKIFQPLFH